MRFVQLQAFIVPSCKFSSQRASRQNNCGILPNFIYKKKKNSRPELKVRQEELFIYVLDLFIPFNRLARLQNYLFAIISLVIISI